MNLTKLHKRVARELEWAEIDAMWAWDRLVKCHSGLWFFAERRTERAERRLALVEHRRLRLRW